MKQNAIGVVEVNYYTNSVVVLDEMLKASDVALVSFHTKLGGRMVHSIVAGETSAVNAAIEAANKARSIVGEKNVKVAVTISNPHPEVLKLLNLIKQGA
ncbi:BMC domain-containing protein [Acetanaerobacterium elongatum]|uniref:BMC domain-containing protein n=1 Tax=Acetanaerobacterium elongatum TaxID=258515 RepID=A0A1H0B1X1_9FIRM|nr:BMC domain-containing protein [Acetanaerobacterium elongatum]SDN39596.1 BMC domain-containing protein [Acetanaerobacterium elongatum]